MAYQAFQRPALSPATSTTADLRCRGERGFALLTQRRAALQHIIAGPGRTTEITRAALVLTQFEHKYISWKSVRSPHRSFSIMLLRRPSVIVGQSWEKRCARNVTVGQKRYHIGRITRYKGQWGAWP